MNFTDWTKTIPPEITRDPLWNMEVYRTALFVGEVAWFDVCKLAQDKRTLEISDQLHRAVGSISANITEGYSKASKKDKARYFEYSLGSTREARDWSTNPAIFLATMYFSTVPVCSSKSSALCSRSSPNFAARKSPNNKRSINRTHWNFYWKIYRSLND